MRKQGKIVLLGLAASLAALLFVRTPAEGGGMTEGLAVAVTADGSRLVAGGSNRVLYELDPATLAVKRRAWLGRQVMAMAFSPDGKVLVVESTTAVQWLKVDTLEPFATVERAGRIRPVVALDGIAMLVPDYTKPAIRVYGFADAKEKAAVAYDPRLRLAAYGVSADGTKLAILHSREKDESEEKIVGRNVPEALRKAKGAALAEFEQRHDGLSALYRVFDVASGKLTFEKRLWYSCQGYADILSWRGDDVYAIGCQDQCARIDAQGEVTVAVLPSRSSAIHVSSDGATLWTGDMRAGARTRLPELASDAFEIEKLPGYNEGLKAFSAAADGMAFAGTTAFRVLRLGADGKIQKAAPVY